MRFSFPIGCVAALLLVTTAAAKEFSQGLTPEEFAAAGLNKLSPEELSRLDAYVKGQRDAAVQRQIASQPAVKAPALAKTGETPSFLNRMRVRLTPGTQIDYETVETELVGAFRGYNPGDVLTLANGQRWKVVEGRYWAPASSANKLRKVSIQPGLLGSFYLEIQDGGRPKVRFVSDGN